MMRELLKKLRFRVSAIFIILSLIVLIDEIVKEDYAFNIFDLFNSNLSHEKIFLILLLLGLIFGLKSPRAIEYHTHGGRNYSQILNIL